MDKIKVLHIVFPEKFFNNYIRFVNDHFDNTDHLFLYLKKRGDEPEAENVRIMKFYRLGPLFFLEMYRYMKNSDKIILHSLFKRRVIHFLFLFPRFSKFCYWYLWGGDLYYRIEKQKKNTIRQFSNLVFSAVVKNLGSIVTHISGDAALAKQWFGFKGKVIDCFMYPSNMFFNPGIKPTQKKSSTLNILLGNSSHKSNNHAEALEKLKYLQNSDIKIFCPLSYGDKKNALRVREIGEEIFGEKFIALTDFMPLEEYRELLGKIDIAVFNHWRQQAMGNIILLLGLGKTVYIRKEITTWQMLKSKNIFVMDFSEEKPLIQISTDERDSNIRLVWQHFRTEKLIEQSSEIFHTKTDA